MYHVHVLHVVAVVYVGHHSSVLPSMSFSMLLLYYFLLDTRPCVSSTYKVSSIVVGYFMRFRKLELSGKCHGMEQSI